MKVISSNSEAATVSLTRHELAFLANAINETQAALEEWEFQTLTSAYPAEAEALRKEISELLDSLPKDGP